MVTPETRLLRQLARPQLDENQIHGIRQLWHQGIDTKLLVATAEKHGIAPLFYQHVTKLELDVGQSLRQQLIALSIRHRKANQARQHALEEILTLFASHRIRSIVLKGAALMHVLYDSIALRPMSDLDILVPVDQAQEAQSWLGQLDYRLHENLNPYLRDHHHLPMASKQVQGISIHVEIHTDALSRDNHHSICFSNLHANPIAFNVGNQTAYSLSHIDMLRHLCHHTLEPVEEIKLIAVSDIFGYATRYLDHIEFNTMDKNYPFVHNTVQQFHYLAPLPERLRNWVSEPVAAAPSGVGKGFSPLSATISSDQKTSVKLRNIFVAPAWWLHCFYEIPPGQSLWKTRLITHPLQIAKWIIRRWKARFRVVEK